MLINTVPLPSTHLLQRKKISCFSHFQTLCSWSNTPVQGPLFQGSALCLAIIIWALLPRWEPGGLPFMGLQKVRHNWTCMHVICTLRSLFVFSQRTYVIMAPNTYIQKNELIWDWILVEGEVRPPFNELHKVCSKTETSEFRKGQCMDPILLTQRGSLRKGQLERAGREGQEGRN